MPELPEVETITNRLRPYLLGKSILTIEQLHPKTFSGDRILVINSLVADITRRAKMIRIHLENNHNLLVHLKMTGQLIYVGQDSRVGGGHPTADWITALPSSHTRIVFSLSDGSTLYFNDQRVFGWIRSLTNEQIAGEFAKYALDVTDPDFTLEYFRDKISHRSSPIKTVIMDNKNMSGVGNIYACDALNLAQISPFRKANDLTSHEQEKLYNSIRSVIQKGIDLGGATTDGKYIDVDGFAGKYQLEARVYDCKGQECKNCTGKIVKEKLAGRGTYYCPECQV